MYYDRNVLRRIAAGKCRRWSYISRPLRKHDRFIGDLQAALAAAAPKRGERVLDVGCGTGTTVLRLAEGVGPSGRVLGVDISEQQLALARPRVAAAGVNQAQLVLDDAPETFKLQPIWCDVLRDPVAAFRNIRGAMKRSGRLLLVSRSGAENQWATGSIAAISHLVPPPAPVGPEEPAGSQMRKRHAARVAFEAFFKPHEGPKGSLCRGRYGSFQRKLERSASGILSFIRIMWLVFQRIA